jgi:WD40 repeat protein
MPLTTAYLDSYNTSIDRINTCIMSAVFSPDNTRLIASDDQGRLGLFYSSPQISSKPIFLTTLANTHHLQTNSTINNNNNNSISLASSANEVLIVVGGSSHNGLVQGYRWSDIISNKKNTQLPFEIFSFDLARGPNEIFVCVQAPSKKQQRNDEIIVGSSIGTLRVLNIERQTLVTTIDAAHKGTIHQIAFANDGKRLASCSEDGKIELYFTTKK